MLRSSPYSRTITSTWTFLKWLFQQVRLFFFFGGGGKEQIRRINFRSKCTSTWKRNTLYPNIVEERFFLIKRLYSHGVLRHVVGCLFPKNKRATLLKQNDVLPFNCACYSYINNSFKLAYVCNMSRYLYVRLGEKGRLGKGYVNLKVISWMKKLRLS